MSRFGWCLDGHHDQCRRSYVSLMGVRQGQEVVCECYCHHKQPKFPRKKRT